MKDYSHQSLSVNVTSYLVMLGGMYKLFNTEKKSMALR